TAVEEVDGPPQLAGGQVEADKPAGAPERKDQATVDGRRRHRPLAAAGVVEAGGVGGGPKLIAGGRVVANDRLVAAALLDADGTAGHHGETGKTGAARLLPKFARRVVLPVARQGRADDDAVPAAVAVAGVIVRRCVAGRQRHFGRVGVVS